MGRSKCADLRLSATYDADSTPHPMVTEAAENNGPMIFARMGVLQAINRHHVREFDTSRPHHWGKRKLKRDE
jgi:hypothetical protein